MSLNGHLLPKWFLCKTPVYVGEYTRGLLGLTFRHQHIVYRKYESLDIFQVELNKHQFIILAWAFFKTSIAFIFKINTLKNSYKKKISVLCSRDFWEDVYR